MRDVHHKCMYKTVVETNSYMSIGITLRNFTYKTSGKGYKVIRIRTRYQKNKNCLKQIQYRILSILNTRLYR